MTRSEFILQRIKDEHSMYRVLTIVCALAALASIALAIAAIAIGKPEGVFTFGAMLLFFAFQVFTYKGASENYRELLEEVSDDPERIADRRDFPRSTVLKLIEVQRPTKEYLQQGIAYGSCSAMLAVGAVIIFMLAIDDRELIFAGLAMLLVLGFLWLVVLAARAFRNWRVSKQLEEFE